MPNNLLSSSLYRRRPSSESIITPITPALSNFLLSSYSPSCSYQNNHRNIPRAYPWRIHILPEAYSFRLLSETPGAYGSRELHYQTNSRQWANNLTPIQRREAWWYYVWNIAKSSKLQLSFCRHTYSSLGNVCGINPGNLSRFWWEPGAPWKDITGPSLTSCQSLWFDLYVLLTEEVSHNTLEKTAQSAAFIEFLERSNIINVLFLVIALAKERNLSPWMLLPFKVSSCRLHDGSPNNVAIAWYPSKSLIKLKACYKINSNMITFQGIVINLLVMTPQRYHYG